MEISSFDIPGPVLVTPRRFGDARGWFCETWNRTRLRASGLDWPEFVQDNHSFSAPRHTLRGLHFQRPPHAQDKLVRCSRGAVLDVAVDARKGSATYGQWVSVELSAATGTQLYVPKGFLHGFLTLTDDCEVQYKCTDIYAPDCDGAVRWNSLGIDWGTEAPVLSEKDAQAMPFAQFETPFHAEG
ncbi:dTDP-4-dehydrorhamnose 3,5-epimerase [Roseinatronobacter alkalisoli]|uniref:dTDP-4-dehydrorhamnose 3,5-epimerase n=1 Tax=Roseinatronobacter alkalisoli TaxID=3028235 RepID=A0ABT5TA21_9RHOB|nr:dTDP-4-dehydrorhamnose 3,5-epimerase [Roseinatronobacter sp. HJB301]MDD7971968.1 dTDP-4-dehydrorhamnose 3,5-epimerase [Roseinatronobacter sp. HJB301]